MSKTLTLLLLIFSAIASADDFTGNALFISASFNFGHAERTPSARAQIYAARSSEHLEQTLPLIGLEWNSEGADGTTLTPTVLGTRYIPLERTSRLSTSDDLKNFFGDIGSYVIGGLLVAALAAAIAESFGSDSGSSGPDEPECEQNGSSIPLIGGAEECP